MGREVWSRLEEVLRAQLFSVAVAVSMALLAVRYDDMSRLRSKLARMARCRLLHRPSDGDYAFVMGNSRPIGLMERINARYGGMLAELGEVRPTVIDHTVRFNSKSTLTRHLGDGFRKEMLGFVADNEDMLMGVVTVEERVVELSARYLMDVSSAGVAHTGRGSYRLSGYMDYATFSEIERSVLAGSMVFRKVHVPRMSLSVRGAVGGYTSEPVVYGYGDVCAALLEIHAGAAGGVNGHGVSDSFVGEQRRIARGMRWDVLERDGFRCVACGRSAEDGAVLEVDHIVPVCMGGESVPSNLRTLCRECNRGKGRKMPGQRRDRR